jgi:hypothetical protein
MKFGEFIFKHPILGTIVGVLTYLGLKMTAMAIQQMMFESWQRIMSAKDWAWKLAKDSWDKVINIKDTAWKAAKWGYDAAMWLKDMAWKAAKWTYDAAMWLKDMAWKAAKMAWDLGMWVLNAVQRVIALSIAMAPVLIALLPLIAIALAVAVIVGFVWYFRKEIWGFIKKAFDWTVGIIKKVWNWALNIWKTLGTPMKVLIGIMVAPILLALAPIIIPIAAIYLLVKYWKPIIGWIKDFFMKAWETFTKIFTTMYEWIWNGLKWYVNLWAKIFSWVWNVLKKGWELFAAAWGIVSAWIIGGFKFAWDGLKSGWDAFMKGWDIVSGWIIGVFKSAWEGVKSAIDWIWGSVQKVWGFMTDLPGKMLDGVKGIIGSIGDALNPFNWFAEGGIVTGPTKAVIGEAGPEAVIPLSGSSGNNFSKILNDFFDTFLPFFKPLVDFLWNSFKPYMPILQAVLDAIYSVVYSIISGLAQLPGWLGGGFFADMLSGMASPKSGGGGGSGKSEETKLLLSIISGDVEDKPVLGLIGKNESEITAFDSSKRPMGMDTMMKINSFITGASESMEVPKYAQNIQKGIDSIGEGIDSLAGKLEKMEKNIVGAVGQGGKTTQQDTQFELSKLMSRNSFNGGKV